MPHHAARIVIQEILQIRVRCQQAPDHQHNLCDRFSREHGLDGSNLQARPDCSQYTSTFPSTRCFLHGLSVILIASSFEWFAASSKQTQFEGTHLRNVNGLTVHPDAVDFVLDLHSIGEELIAGICDDAVFRRQCTFFQMLLAILGPWYWAMNTPFQESCSQVRIPSVAFISGLTKMWRKTQFSSTKWIRNLIGNRPLSRGDKPAIQKSQNIAENSPKRPPSSIPVLSLEMQRAFGVRNSVFRSCFTKT